jgi:hypothetical protein
MTLYIARYQRGTGQPHAPFLLATLISYFDEPMSYDDVMLAKHIEFSPLEKIWVKVKLHDIITWPCAYTLGYFTVPEP